MALDLQTQLTTLLADVYERHEARVAPITDAAESTHALAEWGAALNECQAAIWEPVN
jgi:hypothetical protein